MSAFKHAVSLLAFAPLLGAQAVDLNGLKTAADAYAHSRVQGQAHAANLDLRLMRGDNGGNTAILMVRATDVQRWTCFYDASYRAADPMPIERPRSASVQCVKSVFTGFHMAANPIPDCRTLEDTWMAVSLDGAISALNAAGYIRGFSQVEVKRPDLPNLPADLVYVFTCPWERTLLAVSATTGMVAWFETF